jgi:hypothetical protein
MLVKLRVDSSTVAGLETKAETVHRPRVGDVLCDNRGKILLVGRAAVAGGGAGAAGLLLAALLAAVVAAATILGMAGLAMVSVAAATGRGTRRGGRT